MRTNTRKMNFTMRIIYDVAAAAANVNKDDGNGND